MKVYLVPLPLFPDVVGQHISPETKEAIAGSKVFLVENARTARRFISQLKLNLDISKLRFEVVDKDSTEANVEALVASLGGEPSICVMSEAGCPAVADPGAWVVKAAHKLNLTVVPLVGASSIIMALMGSGLNGQSFSFLGYLPIDGADRRRYLQKIDQESQVRNQTQIFIETPYRNNAMMDEILNSCSAETWVCVAADLTAPTEYIKTLKVKDWRRVKPDLHKRPCVFLLLKK